MRKLIVGVTFLFLQYATMAQENNQVHTVPADVIEAFSMLYPNIKEVNWENKDQDYEARFSNTKINYLLFDKEGNLKQVKIEILESELPTEAKKAIDKEYFEWKKEKYDRIEKMGTTTFEVEVSNGGQFIVLIFDSHGILLNKFLKDH